MNTQPHTMTAGSNPAEIKAVGLRYVHDRQPGIRRERDGDGFRYRAPDGNLVDDEKTLARIKALGIPPAYSDVWICASERGYLQATGHDAKGRKQYRYHPRWRKTREETKYEHMMAFGEALPKIRQRVEQDLSRHGLPSEKVLATVVRLLETTMIRIGNKQYAKENHHYGLTTLHNRQTVDSADVNAYLKEITGQDFTAKDFRTWAGTVLASLALQEFEAFDSETQAKKNVTQAIKTVAERLGNTPTICRKCYVHPAVLEMYLDGTVLRALEQRAEQEIVDTLHSLRPEEAAVMALLQRRLSEEVGR